MENNQPIGQPVLMDASSGPTKVQLEKANRDFASYVPEKIEPFDFDALLLPSLSIEEQEREFPLQVLEVRLDEAMAAIDQAKHDIYEIWREMEALGVEPNRDIRL